MSFSFLSLSHIMNQFQSNSEPTCGRGHILNKDIIKKTQPGEEKIISDLVLFTQKLLTLICLRISM